MRYIVKGSLQQKRNSQGRPADDYTDLKAIVHFYRPEDSA